MLIVSISGVSGAGKTTLQHSLSKKFDCRGVISCTTRKKREIDKEDEYCFYSETEFVKISDFLWQRQIHGNLYGTRESHLIDALKKSNLASIVVAVDCIQPLDIFCEENNLQHLALYLLAPSEIELVERLRNRGTDVNEIRLRINECASWDKQASAMSFVHLLKAKSVIQIARRAEKLIVSKQLGSGYT